ncbi:DNA repair protein RecO [Breznakiellaceae bacterium SP9]
MKRNYIYHAIILRTKASGESNREAWALTAEEGIVQMTAYGGPKSKLRAYVAPFNQGLLYCYYDPVRQRHKVSDFDVKTWRPGLRELYERSTTACSVAQVILNSFGAGGSWDAAFALASSFLDAIETAACDTCPRLLALFLWRWLELLGLMPQLRICALCGKAIPPDSLLAYAGEGNALCMPCAQKATPQHRKAFVPLSADARRWLKVAWVSGPASLSRLDIDSVSLNQATVLAQHIIAMQ